MLGCPFVSDPDILSTFFFYIFCFRNYNREAVDLMLKFFFIKSSIVKIFTDVGGKTFIFFSSTYYMAKYFVYFYLFFLKKNFFNVKYSERFLLGNGSQP